MNDLIGGHVDFFCEQSVSVAEQAKSGAIKAYAVSAAERLPSLPDVPTAKEFGIDYLMSIWAGIFAPKDTPPAVVAKLADALDKALDDAGVRAAHQQSRRLDPRQGGADAGGVRRLREGRDRALGADPEGRGGAGEIALSLRRPAIPPHPEERTQCAFRRMGRRPGYAASFETRPFGRSQDGVG